MTERYFPDDAEIDQWISSYVYDGNNASPVLDQRKAATTGHVCGRCVAEDQRQAGADLVSRTGNRRARGRRGAR